MSNLFIFGEQEIFLFHYHPDLQSFHLLGTRWLFLPDLNGRPFTVGAKNITLIFYILMSLVHLLSFWTLLRRTSWRKGLLSTQIVRSLPW